MRLTTFRYCMLIGALALLGVAVFYFVNYVVVLSIALGNSGVQPFLQHSIRALWLAFGCQAMLIGAMYAIVAYRPHAVSREVIVIFGLMQLVEAILLFTFAGSTIVAMLLVAAAVCVLAGSLLWPKNLPAVLPAGNAAVR